MEGKEVRFGIAGSALFANVTTDTSDGAVNAMHDSFTPLGGGMLMANMMMDEVIIGAPGSGLFGMLTYAIIAVFVAGLMVGRAPEYLGGRRTRLTTPPSPARGFDIARAQIQRAQMLARNLTKLPGVDLTFDVADLPEADASADLTLCLYSVLSHLPVASLPKISSEIARVTSRYFITTVPQWAALRLFP